MDKKKILFVSDFACHTGFARVAENIAKYLRPHYDIDVLALNFHGDPHPLQKQFNIFPATLGTDLYGISRVASIVGSIDYSLVFLLNDIWIVNEYVKEIRTKVNKQVPIVTYTPVDAPHLKPVFMQPINLGVQHSIFYTEFGRNEAIHAGITIPTSVIPHGIDQNTFHFMPQKLARETSGVPLDSFIMLMLDRNQIRKRLDLGVYYFAEWVTRTNKPDNVRLYYHGALQDQGWDLEDMAHYYGIDKRFIITSREMNMNSMLAEDKLKFVYNSADVFWKPCANEGWGLSLMEAMACGVPSIVPQYSALAEWPKGGVEYVNVDSKPDWNPMQVNTIFRTPSLESFIEKAELLYNDKQYRKELGKSGYRIVTKKQFEWKEIANEFHAVFKSFI